jgi:hypothetical protein
MGDGLWSARSSPDGKYLAATVSDDAGYDEVRLVDLQAWRSIAAWPGSADLIVHIDEFGTAYFVSYQSTPEFRSAGVDGAESTLVASLHPAVSVWGAHPVSDGVFVVWGTKAAEVESVRTEQSFVATIELNEGEGLLTEIPVPGVQIGSVDPVSQGPWAPYLYTSPSFTWNPVGGRLLITHADEDVISEVDVTTGDVVEHPVAGTTDLGSGARRWSVLSPDGTSLYVATRSVELIEDDDDWMVITRPAGVKVLDTTTWDMLVRSDEPVSDIWVSPSGQGLIAAGYTTEESESVYRSESTGLYLLDSNDLSVRVHYAPEEDDQWWGPVSFSEAGSIAYLSTWVQGGPRIHALELSSGEILSTAEGTETLEMIGPVGVLASNR